MGSSSLTMQENPSSSGTSKQHMPFQQAGALAVHYFSGKQYIPGHMRTRFDSGFTQNIPVHPYQEAIIKWIPQENLYLAEALSCCTNCLTNPVL